MKLTYRGVSYNYTPNTTPQKGTPIATGTYRGAEVTFHALAAVPEQPQADLTWRGIAYRSGTVQPDSPPTAAPTPAPTQPKVGVADLARNLCVRQHQRMRRREQGMMVRLAAEVGVPVEVAAGYESQIQGKQPHRFSGYARSSTAMS